MKKKLIILTAAILRGDFHRQTIGKFYEKFYKFLIKQFDIHHIINIDEPTHLKNHFNYYENMKIFDEIIPKYVKKIFLKQNKAGFLGAYKSLVKEVEERNLLSGENIYFWLEDDWEPIRYYDFTKLCICLLKSNNSALSVSSKAPLCSFRGGPIMSGTFFKNLFKCNEFMNNTCDPERQVNRWVRCNDTSNANSKLNRIKYDNGNVDNDQIHLILVYFNNTNINLNELQPWSYDRYNKKIKFKYHLITIEYDYKKIKYSKVHYPFRNNNYNLKKMTMEEVLKIFDNNYIKYFNINPIIFHDEHLGRKFTEKYGLKKWATPGDMAGYRSNESYNCNVGNWRGYNIDHIRLARNMTYNRNFFSGLMIILQTYPYLKKSYYDKSIKLNLTYNSHNHGSYPNFDLIGDLLKLNYNPTAKKIGVEYGELNDLPKIFRNVCGNGILSLDEIKKYSSFKKNFTLASKIFNTLFKFDNEVLSETDNFIKKNKFESHKVLGVNYMYERTHGCQNITDKEFILVMEYELTQQKYNKIFVLSDRMEFINKVKEKFGKECDILSYMNENNPTDNQRFKDIALTMENIKKTKGVYDLMKLEDELKNKSKINRIVLKNKLINSIILSKCNLALKTDGIISGFSKILNPKLRIYRVNGIGLNIWPDTNITLYSDTNIRSQIVRRILRNRGDKELKKSIKDTYKDLLI